MYAGRCVCVLWRLLSILSVLVGVLAPEWSENFGATAFGERIVVSVVNSVYTCKCGGFAREFACRDCVVLYCRC